MVRLAASALVAGAMVGGSVFGQAEEGDAAWTSRDEIRAVVAEMLADAESRSSLLDSSQTAGHDGSFFLQDANNNFRLNVRGFTQFRYIANFRDSRDLPGATDADEAQYNFSVARTELTLDGYVVSPSLFYKMHVSFSDTSNTRSSEGSVKVEEVFAGYKFNENWFVKWGQFKPAFLREYNTSDTKQLSVERSVMSAFFQQSFTQGIELGYEGEDLRFQVSYNDGFNSSNTDFNDRRTYILGDETTPVIPTLPYPQEDQGQSDYAVTARAELKLNGTWKQFSDLTAFPKDRFGVMLGAGFHYEGGSNDDPTIANGLTDDYEYLSWTADISLEGPGWNVFAAIVAGYTDVRGLGGTTTDVRYDDYGVIVQGGWFVPGTDWELFGRWDAIFGDDSRSGSSDFHTLTFGTNWYWSGHAAKMTADLVWFMEDGAAIGGSIPRLTGGGNFGYLGDTSDGEIAVRFQFQLMF